MKLRRVLSMFLVAVMCAAVMAGCQTGADKPEEKGHQVFDSKTLAEKLEEYGLDENLRFTETRHITVEVYDRNNDGGSKPDDNFYTDFIKEGLLRDHNIEVTFVPVPRWTEEQEINNLLGANSAPDICVTYSYNTIQTYGKMDAVIDLYPYLYDSEELFPNLWALLGETNIYYNQDPVDDHVWAIEALLFNNMRINTFVREDWLNILEMDIPTTLEEFEAMLYAFRDNAELLLGDEAANMVPFGLAEDVGWRAGSLIESFIPNDVTDRDWYINGFDDRRLTEPGIKEGARKLNEWYNNGLIDPDFVLYKSGSDVEQNLLKAGYVGAFIHNWDYPYREGDNGITASLHNLVGEDACYIAIECFQNDAGIYRKYLSSPVDRKVFFPATNDEPVASLLYLDWISTFENRSYLQIGEEGITHEVMEDGARKAISATGTHIMNSPNNIDYTIVINGLDLGDATLNARSVALGYAGVDSRLIETAYAIQKNEGRVSKHVNVGAIDAEEGIGETLKNKRDVLWATSIVASPDKFDAVFDAAMEDYLRAGGQAIIDERTEKFELYFGDLEWLP